MIRGPYAHDVLFYGVVSAQTEKVVEFFLERHTAITDFLRRTGNLKLAQMLAGHADIGTTANIYAHLDTTDLEAALRALEAKD